MTFLSDTLEHLLSETHGKTAMNWGEAVSGAVRMKNPNLSSLGLLFLSGSGSPPQMRRIAKLKICFQDIAYLLTGGNCSCSSARHCIAR